MQFTTDPTNKSLLLTAGDYPVHRAANIVPLDDQFEPLAESLQRTGLIEPITLYKGEIIDGRRRAITCKELGIVVREDDIGLFGDKTPKEIYEFVLAKNTRRSLSKAQLAMIAAVETSRNSHILMGIPKAVDYAKKQWGVSKATYDKAKYILNNNIGLANDIFSTGFAYINGERTTMVKCYEYLRSAPLEDDRHGSTGEVSQEVVLLFKAVEGFVDGHRPYASLENIQNVLRQVAIKLGEEL